MKFDLQRVEEMAEQRSLARERQETQAAEEKSFADSTEALLVACPKLRESFEDFLSLASDVDHADPDGVAEALSEVRSRLTGAAEAFSGICSQLPEEIEPPQNATGGPQVIAYLNASRSAYQSAYEASGLLEAPDTRAQFDERWDVIYAAQDFIDEACSELRAIRAEDRAERGWPDRSYF